MPIADSYKVTEGVLEGGDMISYWRGSQEELVSLIWGFIFSQKVRGSIKMNYPVTYFLCHF